MKFFITGGAGYIGAHIGDALQKQGHQVRIYDDFSNGLERRCRNRFQDVVKGDILNFENLNSAMFGFDVVIHLAAKKAVGESVLRPDFYYQNNVVGSKNVIEAMLKNKVKKIIFSSTAAVYRENDNSLIGENDPLEPNSPYGVNKMEIEDYISTVSKNNDLAAISLRYFNVVGCETDELSDNSKENLVPKVLQAIDNKIAPEIYGLDYPTEDGTCIRDYIHINDLVSAHLKLLNHFEFGKNKIFNIGSGKGFSVKQVLLNIEKNIDAKLHFNVVGRRPGDIAKLVASIEKIQSETGWKPVESLDSMVKSAWKGWESNRGEN
jgi:UDP-glucose 4-epimerase